MVEITVGAHAVDAPTGSSSSSSSCCEPATEAAAAPVLPLAMQFYKSFDTYSKAKEGEHALDVEQRKALLKDMKVMMRQVDNASVLASAVR